MKQTPLLLFIVLFTCCTSIDVHRNLKDVESYISERPDSALTVLESIDRNTLRTKSMRAHHALLHAMALDKNYINVSDDSLALTAVNYYKKHGTKKNLVRSLYYLGLSYFYDRQYDKAIIELSKAEPIAAIHDSLYLGFVKVLQADIHSIHYSSIEELSALDKALEIYTALKADYYISVAKMRLAQSYMSNQIYAEAEILLEDMLQSENHNKRLKTKIMGDYAFLMGTRPDSDYEKAVCYFDKTAQVEGGRYLSRQDYWVWAHALANIGDIDKSQQIVDMLSPIDSSGTAYFWRYKIAKALNKNDEAFVLHQKFSDKNNDEVVQALQQSISVIQRDYYQSQYKILEYKTKFKNIILFCVILAAIFTIVIIYITTLQYKRRKEFEIEEYIRYAEEINRQLKDLHAEAYTSLQKKYISIYKTKYETIASLFEQYVLSKGRKGAETVVYRQVTALIDNLKKDIDSLEDLERTLDKDLGGIMTRFKTEFPKLRKKDHQLFGYLSLGFDITVISHFMGCTQNTLYIRKSRLKKHLEESESEYKYDYLQIIS